MTAMPLTKTILHKYDFAITEIHKSNIRSIKAHARIGFELIHSYKDPNGDEWDIVIWDWKKYLNLKKNNMENEFANEFIMQSINRNEENTKKIIKCLNEIDETEVWKTPNNNSNSIANLILHLCGNITQYIISALGNTKDSRERDKEFSTKKGYNKSELESKLIATITEANKIIKNIPEDTLCKIYQVQGFNLSGIGIVIHVTEHYSYHTGQIAFWVKQLKNKDLGFYKGIDLTAKNRN